jgi:D-lactate dehydrogenase
LLAQPSSTLLGALGAAGLTASIRATDRLAAAHDASHYQLTPQAVVAPRDAAEVGAALAAAASSQVPVTFRSGGTSLSGQAGSHGLLLDTRRHFRDITVLDDGARVRTGPGATVRAVNTRLARHGRKLGPDPASEIACTIGGVIANNSSGMACGITANTYRTLESAVLVLSDGTVVDTAAPDALSRLTDARPELVAGLAALRDRVRGNPASVETLTRLHAIKNTMGYGLNAFLDHDDPVELLLRLTIGSEGTLAFVADATFRTVPVGAHVATGFLVFDDLGAATAALPALVALGFTAIELLDATSLRVAQDDPEAPVDLRALEVAGHAALLVEFQRESADALSASVAAAEPVLARLEGMRALGAASFDATSSDAASTDPASTDAHKPARALSGDARTRAQLWHLRKGLFTAVAGSRPSGTTALLEDVSVPVGHLKATCEGLIALFEREGYEHAVIFGHAKDGNIHFLLNERFDTAEGLARYERFTHDMVDLVLGQGGSLKAEHGTGRIMAPFVRRQYGDELYEIMREVKRHIDPAGLLNPGVLLSDDPEAHLHHLKPVYPVEAEVDRCVECGYCEPVCPSRDVTLTPRERIVLRREMQRAEAHGDAMLLKTLQREYDYDGVQTCAVDGMCQTACPVLINTGDLVRRLRGENAGTLSQKGWKTAAKQWDAVTRGASVGLTVADALPAALPGAATVVGRALLGADVMPRYSDELPAGGRRRRQVDNVTDGPFATQAVWFSSCTNTMFGPVQPELGTGLGAAESFASLCERAGIRLATPPDLPSLCCGTPWKSKGLNEGYAVMRDKVVASLRAATRDGELPIVVDASSCTEGLEVLLESAGEHGLHVVDAVAFVDEHVLPRLPEITPDARIGRLALHPTCSSTRLGIDGALHRVAAVAADEVLVPDDWNCCAFAGDRGMLHPELTASATAAEAAEVRAAGADAHASLNRTCELGMTRATGQPYQHVLELLERATRPASGGAVSAR